MKGKSQFYYSSAIKLPSAIGDWTQIKADDSDNDFFEVSEINYSNFDGLSKDDLKFVHLLHHTLASLITDHLSHDLNVKIELHTVTATQLLYSDFIESISENVFQANINFSEQGSVNVIFGSKLASMVIDRLVGGKGVESAKQEFNEFELEVLNEQLQQLIPYFQNIWDSTLDFSKAKMTLFSGQYRPDNQISYRGTTVVFTFYLFFGDGELLRFMVAYPSHLISNLLGLFRNKHRTIKSLVKLDKKTVKGIDYKVIAELGTVKLTMNAIQELGVGDIITLNKPIHSFIKLKIGDHVILTGQPCIFKNRLGCQIVLSKKIKSSVALVHHSDDTQEGNISVPVTLNIDSFVDDKTMDAVSETDYSKDVSVVSSEELLKYMPSDLVSEETNYDSSDTHDVTDEDETGFDEAGDEEADDTMRDEGMVDDAHEEETLLDEDSIEDEIGFDETGDEEADDITRDEGRVDEAHEEETLLDEDSIEDEIGFDETGDEEADDITRDEGVMDDSHEEEALLDTDSIEDEAGFDESGDAEVGDEEADDITRDEGRVDEAHEEETLLDVDSIEDETGFAEVGDEEADDITRDEGRVDEAHEEETLLDADSIEDETGFDEVGEEETDDTTRDEGMVDDAHEEETLLDADSIEDETGFEEAGDITRDEGMVDEAHEEETLLDEASIEDEAGFDEAGEEEVGDEDVDDITRDEAMMDDAHKEETLLDEDSIEDEARDDALNKGNDDSFQSQVREEDTQVFGYDGSSVSPVYNKEQLLKNTTLEDDTLTENSESDVVENKDVSMLDDLNHKDFDREG